MDASGDRTTACEARTAWLRARPGTTERVWTITLSARPSPAATDLRSGRRAFDLADGSFFSLTAPLSRGRAFVLADGPPFSPTGLRSRRWASALADGPPFWRMGLRARRRAFVLPDRPSSSMTVRSFSLTGLLDGRRPFSLANDPSFSPANLLPRRRPPFLADRPFFLPDGPSCSPAGLRSLRRAFALADVASFSLTGLLSLRRRSDVRGRALTARKPRRARPDDGRVRGDRPLHVRRRHQCPRRLRSEAPQGASADDVGGEGGGRRPRASARCCAWQCRSRSAEG